MFLVQSFTVLDGILRLEISILYKYVFPPFQFVQKTGFNAKMAQDASIKAMNVIRYKTVMTTQMNRTALEFFLFKANVVLVVLPESP